MHCSLRQTDSGQCTESGSTQSTESMQFTSRGIINILETRVSSIGGYNNKRSGRQLLLLLLLLPLLLSFGLPHQQQQQQQPGVRCESKRGADSCTNGGLHKQRQEQRQRQRQAGRRTRLVSCLVSWLHTPRMRNVRKAQQKEHEKSIKRNATTWPKTKKRKYYKK